MIMFLLKIILILAKVLGCTGCLVIIGTPRDLQCIFNHTASHLGDVMSRNFTKLISNKYMEIIILNLT